MGPAHQVASFGLFFSPSLVLEHCRMIPSLPSSLQIRCCMLQLWAEHLHGPPFTNTSDFWSCFFSKVKKGKKLELCLRYKTRTNVLGPKQSD